MAVTFLLNRRMLTFVVILNLQFIFVSRKGFGEFLLLKKMDEFVLSFFAKRFKPVQKNVIVLDTILFHRFGKYDHYQNIVRRFYKCGDINFMK